MDPSNSEAVQPVGKDLPIVVIGAGPVGLRLVQELRRQDPACRIELFGNERWVPYNRVKLSSFLAGEIPHDEVEGETELPDDPDIHVHGNEAVTAIERGTKSIVTRFGSVYRYRHLVIATGSQPLIPMIPGVGLQGVFTFWDMTDTQRLYARKSRSRHTLIIGGGLLGLECAKAMRRFNTRVTVIEQQQHLMFRQLDPLGAGLLQKHVEAIGITIMTNDSVREILGTYNVQGVELNSGRALKCDTVVLATGITPNIELAREAGLETRRGILVDDQLRASDPDIFAVGECAEHQGEIYGLVAPGYEQAKVAASVIAGKPTTYKGSLYVTSLKVVGYQVTSFGITQKSRITEVYSFMSEDEGIYRKLILEKGRLIGVVALGDWGEIPWLREGVQQRHRITLWQRWRFRRTGYLRRDEQRESIYKPSMG